MIRLIILSALAFCMTASVEAKPAFTQEQKVTEAIRTLGQFCDIEGQIVVKKSKDEKVKSSDDLAAWFALPNKDNTTGGSCTVATQAVMGIIYSRGNAAMINTVIENLQSVARSTKLKGGEEPFLKQTITAIQQAEQVYSDYLKTLNVPVKK